ncbi:FAD-dependent oxidoreductase [Ascidiimonas aurantiaca]|uniref:FAD-dependent oxidoreductase n=1 Tax=Ascidiimonas aurantiaca TaxID=1685432 RepID=UPI0030ED42B7
MKKPVIFVIDDDIQVLRALVADLRSRYRNDYRIIYTDSGKEALEALTSLKNRGEDVALFISDQRMPEITGVDFLEQAFKTFPASKRVLLTAYSDTNAAIKAINEVQLDYYLLKPWNPPEEKLYPVIDDLLEAWLASFIPEFHGLRIIGYPFSPKTHILKDFLSGNLFPYQYLDITNNTTAQELTQQNEITTKELPAVFFDDGSFLKDPTLVQLAEKIGLKVKALESLYDVVIVGAGPAGLAAAVYGGSEGLKTLLIDRKAPGGQAGTSSRIENYLGFPNGLSGQDLTRRAITQATRFGIEFLSPVEVSGIDSLEGYKILHISDGSTIKTKTVVIATGVDYRKLENKSMETLTGAGIYYGAATTEAHICQGKDVFIVGGGNSAGQGAVYLSKFARKVSIVIRRKDLSNSMSQYLIDQIDAIDNIVLRPNSEIIETIGESHLEKVVIKDRVTGENSTENATAMFIFIGARPYTQWTGNLLLKDNKGFLVTGRGIKEHNEGAKTWKKPQEPYLLETSMPGIFAAGDVRSGAMNRIASAVGEGAMAISLVHKYLSEN